MQDFSENFNSLFGNTIKWKPKQMLRDSGSIGKDYHSESAFKIWKKKKKKKKKKGKCFHFPSF